MVWNSLVKDLLRFLKDPTAILMGVAIPLVVGIMIKVAFGGDGGSTPTARVLIVDKDETVVSSFLAGAFNQGPLGDLMETEAVEEDEGMVRIEEGKATAVLIIPQGFQTNLIEDNPDTLRLITNPAQSILPLLVENIMSTLGDAVFYVQRGVGDPIRPVLLEALEAKEAPDVDAITATVPVIGETLEKAGAYLDSPPLTLTKETIDTKPQRSFGELFLPGMLLMGLLFMVQGMSADLWDERENGTLRRVICSSSSLTAWLVGKAAAVAVCSGALALLGLLLARLGFGVPIHNVLLGALWVSLSGAALFMVISLFQVVATTRRGGGILSSVVIFPLVMLGGSFFPFEAMPVGLAAIGAWTPNGSAVNALKGILSPEMVWEGRSMAVVVLSLAVCFSVILVRLKRATEKGTI